MECVELAPAVEIASQRTTAHAPESAGKRAHSIRFATSQAQRANWTEELPTAFVDQHQKREQAPLHTLRETPCQAVDQRNSIGLAYTHGTHSLRSEEHTS